MKQIYLDYASTTLIDKTVAKAMTVCQAKIYGNPGSLHQVGQLAKKEILKARTKIAKILNCKPEEIIFTGSGTESDNLAILGVMRTNRLSPACRQAGMITTDIEHHAILNPAEQLGKEGYKILKIGVNKDGFVDLEELKKNISSETVLVSIIYANNEIGTIQPIKEIAKMIKEKNPKTLFHTDACQATGYLDLNVQNLGVDLMTINAGKIYGPKGVGLLYVKAGTKIEPIIFGGGQERGLRSGTENVAGIIGLATALELVQKNHKKESLREIKLRDYFIKQILQKIPKTVLNGSLENRLPNNINISFLDVEGEAMLLWLDKYGICVSTGSACDSLNLDPSHVILALGKPYEYANGALRFTLGRSTTKKDLDYVLKVLPKIVADLRKISPVRVKI